MQSETLVEEFSRLVREYKQDDGPGGIEAWNLIADFAVDNADAIKAALSAAEPATVKWPIKTDDQVEVLASECGWDNRKYMTVDDYSIWCQRMRNFAVLASLPSDDLRHWSADVKKLREYRRLAYNTGFLHLADWMEEMSSALSAQVQDVERWQDISTAPTVKGNYFFCRLAWGPENDRSTGDGFRWNGRWFAVGTFYKGDRFDECQYEMRQIEVQPTHWMKNPAAREIAIRNALVATSNRSAQVQDVATHRHKKRGGEYVLMGVGRMQAEAWFDHDNLSSPSVDHREVAIYRSVDDESLWVRPVEEFNDGRFEPLPSAPAKLEGCE